MIDEKYLEKLLEKFDFDIEVSFDYTHHRFNYCLKQKVSDFKTLESLMDWIIKEFEQK